MYGWLVHSANIAQILLILVPGLVLFLEFREGIDHDTAHDVLEHDLHEDCIDDIEGKPPGREFLHTVIDGSACVEHQYAAYDILAGLFREIVLPDDRSVGV